MPTTRPILSQRNFNFKQPKRKSQQAKQHFTSINVSLKPQRQKHSQATHNFLNCHCGYNEVCSSHRCCCCMSAQSFTHKSHKITILTTDSYKQLFVLITMLLTVLSVQPLTLTMAAPSEHAQHYQQLTPSQAQLLVQTHNSPYETNHHRQLQEILLAQKQSHKHDHQQRHYYYNNQHNYYRHQPLPQQLTTDIPLPKEGANEEERLRKREISWHDYYNSIMQSQVINWYNPCGGISKMDEKPVKRKRPPPIKKVSLNTSKGIFLIQTFFSLYYGWHYKSFSYLHFIVLDCRRPRNVKVLIPLRKIFFVYSL